MTSVFVGPLVEGPAEGTSSGVDGMETCSDIARKVEEVERWRLQAAKMGDEQFYLARLVTLRKPRATAANGRNNLFHTAFAEALQRAKASPL